MSGTAFWWNLWELLAVPSCRCDSCYMTCSFTSVPVGWHWLNTLLWPLSALSGQLVTLALRKSCVSVPFAPVLTVCDPRSEVSAHRAFCRPVLLCPLYAHLSWSVLATRRPQFIFRLRRCRDIFIEPEYTSTVRAFVLVLGNLQNNSKAT